MSELQNHIVRVKPLIVSFCEVKPKNGKDFAQLDFEIPEYTLHPTNFDNYNPSNGRGISVYTHKLIQKVMSTRDSAERKRSVTFWLLLQKSHPIHHFDCEQRKT